MKTPFHPFSVVLRTIAAICLLFMGWSIPVLRAADAAFFEFRDGDRIALIGDSFIEREQSYGYIEHLFTVQFPDRDLTFRNLGWSGDTPAGLSRLGFDIDSPQKGLERIREQLTAFKPTVLIVGYGTASSFDGEAGVSKFAAEYNRLLDAAEEISGKGNIRFVLFSPLAQENLPPPLPDATKHNADVQLYAREIERIAEKRGARFVSLLKFLDHPVDPQRQTFTDDGIHLTAFGYRRASEEIARALGWQPTSWRVGLLADGQLRGGHFGARILEHTNRADYAKLVIVPEQVEAPPRFPDEAKIPTMRPANRLQVQGLKAGQYELHIDGKTIRNVTD